MRAFINTYLSYMKAGLISLVCASSLFFLSSMIRVALIRITGISSTGVGIIALALGAIIFIISLSMTFGLIRTPIGYLELAAYTLRHRVLWFSLAIAQFSLKQKMERKLLHGDISPALRYFWREGDFNRISKFLRDELPLPTYGLRAFFSDSPNFREIISTTFENAINLRVIVSDSNNTFLTPELKLRGEEALELCTNLLWQSCHRLSIITRSGADKHHLQTLLNQWAAELTALSQVLSNAFESLSYIIVAGGINTQDAAKSTLAILIHKAEDMIKVEASVWEETMSFNSSKESKK